MKRLLVVALVVLSLGACSPPPSNTAGGALVHANCQPVGLLADGRLVFNEREPNGLWDVRAGDHDCANPVPLLPAIDAHRGASDVSKDGRYVLLETATGPLRANAVAEPGKGYGNDIQVLDTSTGKLTTPVTGRMGTIWARFNDDATKIAFSQMLHGSDLWNRMLGAWELHVINADGTGDHSWQDPAEAYDPATGQGGNFIEPYGWVPGTDRVIFASDAGVRNAFMWWLGTQLWSLPDSLPAGDERTRLSTGGDYKEFAHFHDGRLYTSIVKDAKGGGMDLWSTLPDGSDLQRVSWFGGIPDGAGGFTQAPGYPAPRYVVVGDVAWVDGAWLAGVSADSQAASIDAYRINP